MKYQAYKLLLVALSICSSRAVLADEDHQLIMTGGWAVCSQTTNGTLGLLLWRGEKKTQPRVLLYSVCG